MFKKLLSNLPFNPSLIGQVSFYAQRMHQEEKIRRLGIVMVVLAVFVQMFAVISPPEPTMARSANDIIPGGFELHAHAHDYCKKNSYDFRTILSHYGISCDALARATTKTIRSTDYNRKIKSLGRLPYGKAGERAVRIGGKTYYERYLWGWDSGPYSTYKALVGTRSNGQPFIILFNCANPAIVEAPEPPPPPPPPAPKDVCPNKPGLQTSTTQCDVCPKVPGTQTNTSQCDVCPNIPGEQSSEAECKPCEDSEDDNDVTACLILSKEAKNETQNIENADGTVAQAGDVITYTLTVKNTSKVTVPKFEVQENIADILDYATVTEAHGGKVDDNLIMVWAPTDIAPGKEISKQLTIKVKDPIPQTPVSYSNPGTFDLTMTNVYGNAVNIELPPSVTKTTEQVVQSLPNTGPGESLAVAVIVTVFFSYFFARTRLFAKELDIVKTDYVSNGGY